MIRRELPNDPNHVDLIAQHDHALLAAQIAEHVHPKLLTSPLTPSANVAIEQHDCGWPLHDDEPTLNSQGQPLDVFESPLAVALSVWTASVDRVQARDPYAALLISLHVFSLSLRIAAVVAKDGPQAVAQPGEKLTAARARFRLNQFQHREIERHEQLRRAMGWPADLPLQHGLATNSRDLREQTLSDHFRFLQAMDRLSLAICCTSPPIGKIDLSRSARGRTVMLNVRRIDAHSIQVDPWPFTTARIDVNIPARRVLSRYDSIDAFRSDFAAAPPSMLPQSFVR